MTRHHAIAPVCAALLLAACATQEPSVPPALTLDALACDSELKLTGAIPVVLSENKNAFEAAKPATAEFGSTCVTGSDGARRSYAVFALPSLGEPYLLRVTSLPLGPTLLSPRLLLLDEHGRVLRERARDTFVFKGTALYSGVRAHPEERYLVVESDPASVGQEVPHIAGQVQQTIASTGFVTIVIYSGSEQKRSLVYAHNGKVSVSAQRLPKAE